MKEGKAKFENKGLLILLCVLLVAIAGLGIGIGVVMNLQNGGEVGHEANYTNDSVSALEVEEYISNNLDNDPNYSIQDAVVDYEREMSVGDNSRRVYVAIYYADFIYGQDSDLDGAVGILRRVEDLIGEDETAVSYYATLRGLYRQSGMESEADFYNQKVSTLMPKDDRSIEDLRRNKETDYEEDSL